MWKWADLLLRFYKLRKFVLLHLKLISPSFELVFCH